MTGGELAPILSRLKKRRVYLLERVALMEAAGDLDTPGGEIAFEALYSEMEFLLDVHRALLLGRIKRRWLL